MLLVTVVAQFTAKTTNSEKAIYFLLVTSCSINKLKPHMLLTCKLFMKRLYVFQFNVGKKNYSKKWWGRGMMPSCPPTFSTTLDLWTRQCCIVIRIVVTNAILVVQRRIDRKNHQRCSINRCSYKFPNIHGETLVPESLL